MNEQGRFSLFFCLTLFDEIHKHRRVGNIQDFSFLHILFGKFVGADYRKPFISGDFSAFSLISKIFYSMSIASASVKKCSFRSAARIHVDARRTVPSA